MSIQKSLLLESLSRRKAFVKGRLNEASADQALEDAVDAPSSPTEAVDNAQGISAEEKGMDETLKHDPANSADQAAKNAFTEMRDQIEQSIEQSNSMLEGWADRIKDFLAFLNDPNDEGSVKYALDNSIKGSPIESVKSSIASSIRRVASQLAALEQQVRSEIGATDVSDVMNKTQ